MTPIPERLLMGPGPSNPYPEVTAALVHPVLGHLDPAFLSILDATCDRLRTVFGTANPLTLPLSGTGSAGMEASFVNFVRPGDPVVVGVNGLFGERMCEVASRLGADVVRVDAPWGQPLDPEAVLAAHPSPAVIAVVHAETSTGVRNDVAPLGEGKGDALLVVDMVTSLGGMETAVDRWQVDVAYSGTQKCLGVPPGLAPMTVSERARARLVARPSSWYLDLNLLSRYVDASPATTAATAGPATTAATAGPATATATTVAGRTPTPARVYHHTAPVTMVGALHAGLGAVLAEGLPAAWARHEECGRMLQDGLAELGLALFAAEGHRLPQLTTVVVPERLPGGMDEAGCRRALLDRYGIEIGGGAGELAGRVWRIGCMGHTARPRNVAALLGALDEILEQ